MDWLFNSILDWFAGVLLRTLDVVITMVGRALLVSPDVTALPQVKALAGRSVWVVDTVFVLAFLAAAALGPKQRVGGSISSVVREHIKSSLSNKPAALLLLVILAVVVALVATTALGLITRLAVLLVLAA